MMWMSELFESLMVASLPRIDRLVFSDYLSVTPSLDVLNERLKENCNNER